MRASSYDGPCDVLRGTALADEDACLVAPSSTRVSVPSVVGKLLLSRSPEQSWLSFVTPTVAGLLGRCPSYASTGRVRFAVGLPGGMRGAPSEKSAMSADEKRDGCHLRRNREGEAVSNAVAHEGVAHFSLRHSRSRFLLLASGAALSNALLCRRGSQRALAAVRSPELPFATPSAPRTGGRRVVTHPGSSSRGSCTPGGKRRVCCAETLLHPATFDQNGSHQNFLQIY